MGIVTTCSRKRGGVSLFYQFQFRYMISPLKAFLPNLVFVSPMALSFVFRSALCSKIDTKL